MTSKQVFCTFCTPKTPIDVRNHAQHLNESIWNAYLEVVTESAIIKEQQRFEKILQNHIAVSPFEVAKMAIEKLTLPSCPKCNVVITDFEACCELVCGRLYNGCMGGCGALLCGWCFQICKADDHGAHVRYCIYNPRPGEVFPESKVVWKEVQIKLARDRVLQYLSTAPRHLTSDLLAMIAKEHPQLRLQPSIGITPNPQLHLQPSTGGSSGPHLRPLPTPRQGTFIGNVDLLIAMQIATRSRAEQVLESNGNDLQAAIHLLLAANTTTNEKQ